MANLTLVKPQTAAASNAIFDTSSYDTAMLFADGLAGAEEVDVFVMGGTARVPYSVGTTVQKLTATAPMLTLQPGVTYSIDKDATAAACGVYLAVAQKN
jgi:hypothetical protein